ncbi:hypothetical protein ACQP3C_31115, partial [Escherichia coli]
AGRTRAGYIVSTRNSSSTGKTQSFPACKIQEKDFTYVILKDMQHAEYMHTTNMHNSTDKYHRALQEGFPLFTGFPG